MQLRIKLDYIIGVIRIARLRPYYYRNQFGVELGCCGIMLYITKVEPCIHCQEEDAWLELLKLFVGGEKT